MNLCIYLIWISSVLYNSCRSDDDNNKPEFDLDIPDDLGEMKNPGLMPFSVDNQYKNTFCSNYCPNHTMCIYIENPHECVRNITSVGIGPVTKLFIVRLHNIQRNNIASGDRNILPTAANMQSLVWHDQLAVFAQRWANQCIHEYEKSAVDECRDMLQFGVKQIVYTRNSTAINEDGLLKWQNAISKWFNPNITISLHTLSHFKIGQGTNNIDRLSYLLNADFQFIGCGYMEFTQGKETREVYVCNYGPMRYSIVDELYIAGYSCTMCYPDQTCSNIYPSLCKDSVRGCRPTLSLQWTLFLIVILIRTYQQYFI